MPVRSAHRDVGRTVGKPSVIRQIVARLRDGERFRLVRKADRVVPEHDLSIPCQVGPPSKLHPVLISRTDCLHVSGRPHGVHPYGRDRVRNPDLLLFPPL